MSRGKRALDDLDAQIRDHIDREILDNLQRGMSAEDARNAALRKFGNLVRVKEQARDVWTVVWLDRLLQDLRYGLRGLSKAPGFALTAIFTLSLGMAAALAIFAFVDSALIRPLPYLDPGHLMSVSETSAFGGRQIGYSYPNYLDMARFARSFALIGAYDDDEGFVFSNSSGAQQVHGTAVTSNFFRILGVAPILGRDFDLASDSADFQAMPSTMILSYAAWQSRFAGRQDVVGSTVTLNSEDYTVIGVLPRAFEFAPAGATEFWTSLHALSADACFQSRGCTELSPIARLKDGVTPEQAASDVQGIAAQEAQEHPDPDRKRSATVVPFSEVVLGDMRPILLALLCGAGLLLLIAYVNVTSLLLVRSENRRREFAVRSALGAAGARLVQQFVTEGFLLAAASSALGLLLATFARSLLLKLIPAAMLDRMPYLRGDLWTWHVAALAVALVVIACMIFALTPTLRLPFADLRAGLATGGRGSAAMTWRQMGTKLVVLELATTMVLLCGAGLLGKSLYQLLHVDVGFEPSHLATMEMLAPEAKNDTDAEAIILQQKVLRALESVPGVSAVATANNLPVSGVGSTQIGIDDRPNLGFNNEIGHEVISEGYLGALGAHLLEGRNFNENDTLSAPLVAIIDQTTAHLYFPDQDPVGKQIYYHAHDVTKEASQPRIQVVGVVADIKQYGLDARARPVLYTPFAQGTATGFDLVVRTSEDAAATVPSLIAAIHNVDSQAVVSDPRTMPELIQDSQTAYWHRATSWLVGGFAGLALLLSMVGLYGVVAFSVSRRTREIGVRMALGAEPSSVYRLILKEAGWLTMTGLLLGIAGAIAAGVLMRTLLFGVSSWDVSILGSVAALLFASALLASYLPARRAASVNPVEALRAE
jgi:macrolide transport system ATP-binding/permease protein